MVRIKREYFDMIAAGTKDLEARTNCVPFKYILTGQSLRFVCGKDSLVREVAEVRRYRSFEDMLDNEPVERLVPGAQNAAQALAVYRSIYTPEKEAAGVLVFDIPASVPVSR